MVELPQSNSGSGIAWLESAVNKWNKERRRASLSSKVDALLSECVNNAKRQVETRIEMGEGQATTAVKTEDGEKGEKSAGKTWSQPLRAIEAMETEIFEFFKKPHKHIDHCIYW